MATVGEVIKVWDVAAARCVSAFVTSYQSDSEVHTLEGTAASIPQDNQHPGLTFQENSLAQAMTSSKCINTDSREALIASILGSYSNEITKPSSSKEFYRQDIEKQLTTHNQAVNISEMWSRLSDVQRAPYVRR